MLASLRPNMPPCNANETRAALAAAVSEISSAFDRVALERLAATLLSLGACLDREQFRVAAPGQELLYALVENPNGPSLYLVSDGVGTSSPPHEHLTWALIVGIEGQELNTFYAVQAQGSRHVHSVSAQGIGAGEFAVLDPSLIHSTSVVGTAPTYHLHLYGRSLASLPPFSLRTYLDGAQNQQ